MSIAPGARQQRVKDDAQHIYRLLRPAPIEPMASPCLPGFLTRKQAGDPR